MNGNYKNKMARSSIFGLMRRISESRRTNKKDFRPVVKPTTPIDLKHKYRFERCLEYF